MNDPTAHILVTVTQEQLADGLDCLGVRNPAEAGAELFRMLAKDDYPECRACGEEDCADPVHTVLAPVLARFDTWDRETAVSAAVTALLTWLNNDAAVRRVLDGQWKRHTDSRPRQPDSYQP